MLSSCWGNTGEVLIWCWDRADMVLGGTGDVAETEARDEAEKNLKCSVWLYKTRTVFGM